MRQTVEEAAKQGAEGYNIVGQNIYKSGFIAGSEWQKKQVESDITQIKVGDLVETCDLIPGFVVRVDSKNTDNIEVMRLDKIGKYLPGRGASHNIINCGVHKISTKRATMLCVLGEKKLKELYGKEGFDYGSDDNIRIEVEKMKGE